MIDQSVLSELDEAEGGIIVQALNDFSTLQSPLAATYVAVAARGVVDLYLKRIAPEDDVKQSPWYVKESAEREVTRAQQFRFALESRLEPELIQDLNLEKPDEVSELIGLYRQLNENTHFHQLALRKNPSEVKSTRDLVVSLFEKLVELPSEHRASVEEAVEATLQEAVQDGMWAATLDELLSASTHYDMGAAWVTSVDWHDVSGVVFSGVADGQFDYTAQFGSHRDREKGGGLEVHQSGTFSCQFSFDLDGVKNISDAEIKIEEDSIMVSTDSGDEETTDDF